MNYLQRCSIAVLSLAIAGLVAAPLPAADDFNPTYKRGEYPEPRYPDLKKLLAEKDLVEIASAVATRKGHRDPHHPGYDIEPGKRVLIIADRAFDRRILDAFVAAIGNAGGRPELLVREAKEAHPWDGWMEVTNPLLAVGAGVPGGRYAPLIKIGTAGEYDLVAHGTGGPVPSTHFGWEYMHWDSMGKYLTGAPDFPGDVRELIERKVWDLFTQSRRVHITDAEGTDISWTMKPEYFKEIDSAWPGYEIIMKGHVSLTPLFFTPDQHDANGVLAGTVNHSGGFPHIKVHIENSKVVDIEGGGRYGRLWREFLERYSDVEFPGYPGKGAGYLVEAALGTQPKVARPPEVLRTERPTWERLRSGVIHFGLGLTIPPGAEHAQALEEFIRDNDFLSAHFHVHTYFTTVDFLLEDGRNVRLVDKGRLTVLDDPEVRALASRHGDPDEILAEAWIPEIPGINVPGDYFEDFANDPTPFILREIDKYYDDEFIPDVDHPALSRKD